MAANIDVRALCSAPDFDPSKPTGVSRLLASIETEAQLAQAISETSRALDDVDAELVAEVADRADEMCRALENVTALCARVTTLADDVAAARDTVHSAESHVSEDTRNFGDLVRTEAALADAQRLAQLVVDIFGSQREIQSLLDDHRFSDARALVSAQIRILDSDLSGVVALEPIHAELREMAVALDKMQAPGALQ